MSGTPLANAFVRLKLDMSDVAPDLEHGFRSLNAQSVKAMLDQPEFKASAEKALKLTGEQLTAVTVKTSLPAEAIKAQVQAGIASADALPGVKVKATVDTDQVKQKIAAIPNATVTAGLDTAAFQKAAAALPAVAVATEIDEKALEKGIKKVSPVSLPAQIALSGAQVGRQVEESANSQSSRTAMFATGAALGGLLVAGIASAQGFISGSFAKLSEVSTAANQIQRLIGGSIEDASRLRFAAQETGVSTDSLTVGLKTLDTHLEKNDSAAKHLGISYRDAAGNLKPMADLLPLIAQRFAELPNGPEKSALAVQLFGRSGTALLPLLSQGAAGFRHLADESDKFGATINQQTQQQLKDHIKAQREFDAALDSIKITLGGSLLPLLDQAGHLFTVILTPAVAALSPLLRDVLVPAVEHLADGFSGFLRVSAGVANWLGDHKALIVGLAAVIGTVLLPELILWANYLRLVIATQISSFLTSVVTNARAAALAIRTFAAANPELLILAGTVAAVTAAVAIFSDHQKTAKISVDELTDALKRQATDGGQAARELFVKALQGTDFGDKGENALEYLKRYKVNLQDLYGAIHAGDTTGIQKLLQPIISDPSVNLIKTKARLVDFFESMGIEYKDAKTAIDELNATQSELTKTTGASGDAASATAAHLSEYKFSLGLVYDYNNKLNQSLSGQIDFFKGVAAQSDVTAGKLLKNAQDAVQALIGEASNITQLKEKGLSGQFIEELTKQGPDAIAAVNKLTAAQLQQYSADRELFFKAQNARDNAIRGLGADQRSTDITNRLDKAQLNVYLDGLLAPAQRALSQLSSITKRAGNQIPLTLADSMASHQSDVLAAATKTFPVPMQKAIAQAIQNADNGGAGTGHGFAKGLDSATPFAITKAQALRLGINTEMQKVLTRLGIVVTTDDQASGKIDAVTKLIATFNANAKAGGFNLSQQSPLALGVAAPGVRTNAHGNLFESHSAEIAKAGAMRLWAEPETGGEAYIPLSPAKRARSLDIWAQTGRHLGVTGFADGGFSGETLTKVLNLEPALDKISSAAGKAAAAATAPAGPGQSFGLIVDFMRRSGVGFTQADPGLGRGGHSFHEAGEAIDFSGGNLAAMAAFWHKYTPFLLEEIHSPGYYVKNGHDVGPAFYGPDIVAQHFNHVHIAASLAAMRTLMGEVFDTGGVLQSGGTARNLSGQPEAVLTNAQWGLLTKLVSVAGVQTIIAGDVKSSQTAIANAVKEGNGPLQKSLELQLKAAQGSLYGAGLSANADGKVTASEFGAVAARAKTVTDLTAQLTKLNTVNAGLITKLGTFVTAQQQFRDTLQSSISQGSGFSDLLGESGTTGDLKTLLAGKLADVRAFAGKVTALKKQGWPDVIIRDVAGAGVGMGIQYADLLLHASSADKASISSLAGQLSSTQLGTANSITQLTGGTGGLSKAAAIALLNKAIYTPGANVDSLLAGAEFRQRTYDSGGPLLPGWTMAYNGTGQTEHVTTAAQQQAASGPLIGTAHIYNNTDFELKLRQAEFMRNTGGHFG